MELQLTPTHPNGSSFIDLFSPQRQSSVLENGKLRIPVLLSYVSRLNATQAAGLETDSR